MNDYDKTTWPDAQKRCRSFNGGDLVSILTNEENEYISRKILELNPDLKKRKDYYFPWIGLYIKKRRNGGNCCLHYAKMCGDVGFVGARANSI